MKVRSLARVVLTTLVCALANSATAQDPMTDQHGRVIAPGESQRILSLGPDITEIVFALGGADRVIARDRSSRYPEAATAKADVGYRRTLSPEALVGLMPDLILAAEDIGPPETVDVLEGLEIPMLTVPEDNSPAGIARKIDMIAAVLDQQEAGVALREAVLADFAAAEALGESIPVAERKKVVFFHGLARLTGAGNNTAAGSIIEYAGGINPLEVYDGYKAVSEESLLTLAPDVVLMLSDGKGGPTADEVFSHPALALTPAGINKQLIVLEGPYMLGFGPRTSEAVRDLTFALYPELAEPAAP